MLITNSPVKTFFKMMEIYMSSIQCFSSAFRGSPQCPIFIGPIQTSYYVASKLAGCSQTELAAIGRGHRHAVNATLI